MRQVETVELRMLNDVLQLGMLVLAHLPALGTYLMVMRFTVVTLFILGGVSELVLDYQMRVDEQDNGIVERRPAYPEVLAIYHQRVKRINVKMSIDRINRFEYGIAFRGFPMPSRFQIFGKYLSYGIFHVLNFHFDGVFSFKNANKVNLFSKKAIRKRAIFKPEIRVGLLFRGVLSPHPENH